jgi:hypothetical protein
MTVVPITLSLYDYLLSDDIVEGDYVAPERAEAIFQFFRDCPLFNWLESHNGCEARADAVCLLLDAWNIPNYKAWVFGGYFLRKHFGGLKKNWKYHVATALPVMLEKTIRWYIIDPATSNKPETLNDWAAHVTAYAHSYHMVKDSRWYIFSEKKIEISNWNERNKQNRKWMIQGLAGVNSLNALGKSQLTFNKGRIKNRLIAFEKLINSKPAFLK